MMKSSTKRWMTLKMLMTHRSVSPDKQAAFLYLPEPPPETEAEFYLDSLTALTDNWPPTLMVRGVSPVTSTTL